MTWPEPYEIPNSPAILQIVSLLSFHTKSHAWATGLFLLNDMQPGHFHFQTPPLTSS
jgi:hypothetical protein